MAIISQIGRKNWRVRLLFLGMYVFLAIGGASMVYPFLLMLSGSTKSSLDIKFFDILPRFLYDEDWMWAKHSEGLFNESIPALNYVYDADEVSFENLPEKQHLASQKDVFCPECKQLFTAKFADCREQVLHSHEVQCPNPECGVHFSCQHGVVANSFEHQLLLDFNPKLVQEWENFISEWERGRENEPRTTFNYSPGYLQTPVSRTSPRTLYQFKKYLQKNMGMILAMSTEP